MCLALWGIRDRTAFHCVYDCEQSHMKSLLAWLFCAVAVGSAATAQTAQQGTAARSRESSKAAELTVVLLGTGAGPPPNPRRSGPSTLIIANSEYLLFDCGRGVSVQLARLQITPGLIRKVFITHLHSDHVIGLPDLYLTGWISANATPFRVWGPTGTRRMMAHIQKAFAYDIHVRRDVDEKLNKEAIELLTADIQPGVVYNKRGVKVTAFLVDHAPIEPAFGYRIDYAGHSVVLSGDTRFSENLIKHAQNVDVLIHEAVNPQAIRAHRPQSQPPDRLEKIIAHHTSAEQAGMVFARSKPRLAVFSHINDDDLITPARKNYSGPLETGEDLMTIVIGEKVAVRKFTTAQ